MFIEGKAQKRAPIGTAFRATEQAPVGIDNRQNSGTWVFVPINVQSRRVRIKATIPIANHRVTAWHRAKRTARGKARRIGACAAPAADRRETSRRRAHHQPIIATSKPRSPARRAPPPYFLVESNDRASGSCTTTIERRSPPRNDRQPPPSMRALRTPIW